jgi:hypothetical protein
MDVAVYEGRGYPNKPPGVTLLGVPAYFLISKIEDILGIDKDRWFALTLNLYLTTVLSVGLLGALGGVVFYRVSLHLFPSIHPRFHLLASLSFSLGTLVLPYSTLFFDHVPVATFLLLSFALIRRAVVRARERRGHVLPLFGAGLCAGAAVVSNYAAVLAVLTLIAYVFFGSTLRRRTVAFVAGGLPLALFLGYYHLTCFGSPFATSYSHQATAFVDEGSGKLLGVFGVPDWRVALSLLGSTKSGVLLTSPILLLSPLALFLLWRRRDQRSEWILFVSTFLLLLLMNASFNHPHGGWAFGPRYLVPAIPFLALPLALVFATLPRISIALASLSIAVCLTVTTTDPQMPWRIPELVLKLFARIVLGGNALSPSGGQISVSGNPGGVYEGRHFHLFPPNSPQVHWNSFNLGEVAGLEGVASIAPLVIVLMLAIAVLLYYVPSNGKQGCGFRRLRITQPTT